MQDSFKSAKGNIGGNHLNEETITFASEPKTTQHTDGEWYVGEANPGNGWFSVLAPAIKRGGPVRIICNIQKHSTNAEANARLIASAPKLLEALECAYIEIERAMKYGSMMAKEANPRLRAIKSAIALAKGDK